MPDDLHLVTFRIGTEIFGVPISSVQEIVRVPQITRIPQSPEFVEGVVNLRGRIIPVIDMHKRLGRQRSDSEGRDIKNRILVVEAGRMLIGVIVDAVEEVIKLSEERVEAAPAMVAGIDNQYLKGIGKLEEHLLILIDIEKILSIDEVSEIIGMDCVAA